MACVSIPPENMALHLDLTGFFGDGSDGRLTRAAFEAALPRAAAAREAHLAHMPKWRTLHERDELFAACRSRAATLLERGDIDDFVVLGIGGSALGNSAMLAALAPVFQDTVPQAGHPRVHILDNVDPDWFAEFFESIDPARTHFNVISKSGGTIETSSAFLVAWDAVRKGVMTDAEAVEHFTLTTDPETGHFRKLADEMGFATLPVPDGVGGRFSVLSPVGLFMSEMAGLDTQSMLEGAARVDKNLRDDCAIEADPAAAWALAHVLYMESGKPIHVHFPYAHRLRLMGDWFAQLWAESLGKKVNLAGDVVHVGPTPVTAVGATDQHSQVQLFTQGPDDKVYTMVKLGRFAKTTEVPEPFADSEAFRHLRARSFADILEAERQGTEVALLDAGRPVCVMELCKLDAFHVGQFFAFFEVATAIAGGIMQIDPFDQPGVEAGKIAALSLMGVAGFEDNAERIQAMLSDRDVFSLSC